MSGIYLHIPFCKQACHYCDFHFSTSLKKRGAMVDALCRELMLRKEEQGEPIETIYFGGGTPSLLTSEELEQLFRAIYLHYDVIDAPEITLEANPDDLTHEKVMMLSQSKVNRLSIGVQSFFEEDLQLMNRAHNAEEALTSIAHARAHFENISIDLIYGMPKMTNERWLQNVEKALALEIPHLSCYALTIEPRTALEQMIKKGTVAPIKDSVAESHYHLLLDRTSAAGYENYEFSNFGLPGWHSRNNTAYWHGKSYLGIGPSAHSYNGKERSWNVANNAIYLREIAKDHFPLERETISLRDAYNEYVMTRLRTKNGIILSEVKESFGSLYHDYALTHAAPHLSANRLQQAEDALKVTRKGAFLTDGIASDLFKVDDDFHE